MARTKGEVMHILHWLYVVAAVVLLFGAAIFVHEFGHFWTARRLGLKVDGFSIGFGPKLFGWTRNGVEYAWRLIPAGGFVALPQMSGSETFEGKSQATEKLPSASALSKILVALAGPTMNGVFAFVVAAAIYFLGLPVLVNPPIVGSVEPGSAEARLGIRAGDRIVAVDGRPVQSWEDVQMTTAMAPTNVVPVTIERNNVRTAYLLHAKVNPELGLKLLDLEPSEHPVIEQVFRGGAGDQAGLQPGDEVLAFNEVPIAGEEQLVNLIKKHPGKPCHLEVKRGGHNVNIRAVPASNLGTGAGILGVMLAPSAVTVYKVQRPGPAPWSLVAQIGAQIFRTVGALVHSRQTGVGVGQLSGPPGILAMLAIELKTDYRLGLKFMVLLNLSLAMINLLPLPVLDGGHIALAVFEKIRRRPLSPRIHQYATMAFAVLLIYLMLYVSYNDVVHRFSLFKSMFEQQTQIQPSPGLTKSTAPDRR